MNTTAVAIAERANHRVAEARGRPDEWHLIATYPHQGSAYNAKTLTLGRRWAGHPVLFEVRKADNGYSVYANWPTHYTPPQPPQRHHRTNRLPVDDAYDRVLAARSEPGATQVAEYKSRSAAEVAARTTFPRRFAGQPVTFKARSANRRHYVYAEWEPT